LGGDDSGHRNGRQQYKDTYEPPVHEALK
jgi:hypothetical protein